MLHKNMITRYKARPQRGSRSVATKSPDPDLRVRRPTKWSAASSYRGGPLGADAGRLVATLVCFRPAVLLQSGILPSRNSRP